MTTLILITTGLLIGFLVLKIRLSFGVAITSSLQFYCIAWFIYGCVYFGVYLAEAAIVLMLDIHHDWTTYLFNHKWIIQGVIYLIPILGTLISSLSGGVSNKNSTKHRSYQKTRIKPIIIPVATSNSKKQVQKKNVRAINRKNLIDLKNNLRNGISLTISIKDYCDSDLYELSSFAGQYGTRLSLLDCDLVSIRQLANIARNGRGFIKVDSIVDAGLEAEELAEKGVCFTCDCKNRSTAIKYIVDKAKKANGKIILINCRHLSSIEIAEIRQIGKDNVEIK